ncbi:hypothetical protein BGI27_16390 [Candidatus Dactylopiibacterium carminicum]|uniref:Chemotaxis methyl-accepting receptor HlyB-like 4HB MCP domain-containing protein n=2 Tax=Candidatus Dactylopiibacterium carminicum TaxID=857335 RepID=A0ABQ7HL27_9RHOO|nr:MCP four helix bundle domain-containing protein [Candidatus Dactylopiibacterium carminicum]KAF7597863.1 hypothetical protein BGI27_16390 [Candidatus Dactylopiibacterium carminicum]PAS95784.1 MAG: hypothetical protein BSR46_16425 [Candidatus Dactylopiibacterium carminicum]
MNLSITQRLILLACASTLALFVVALAGHFSTRASRASLDDFQNRIAPGVALLNKVERDFLNVRRDMLLHVIELYDTKKDVARDAMAETRKQIDADLDRYESELMLEPGERELLTQVRQLLKTYDEVLKRVMDLSYNYDTDAAREVISTEGLALGRQISAALDAHRRHNEDYAARTREEANLQADLLLRVEWGVGVLAIL